MIWIGEGRSEVREGGKEGAVGLWLETEKQETEKSREG
jgi:hypothetical protein